MADRVNRTSGITRRLLWWSLGISLIPMLIGLLMGRSYTTWIIEREATESVSAIADIKAEQFETYIHERSADIHVLAHLRRVAVALRDLPPLIVEPGIASPEYSVAELDVRQYFEEVVASYAYDDVFLVSPAGDELFSLRKRGELATNYTTGPYRETDLALAFQQTLATRKTFVSPFAPFERSGTPAAFLAAPVFQEEEITGVLILQLGIDSIVRIADNYVGLGTTGEIILVQQLGDGFQFVTPTRHDPHAAFLRRMSKSDPSARRLRRTVEKPTGTDLGTDYRGVETIAAWRYLPGLNLTMVVKVDTQELFEPAAQEMQWAVLIGSLTLLTVAGIAVRGARSITRPIVQLTDAARHMAQGRLTQTVEVAETGEIGELARSFNSMSTQLRSMYSTIEDQVRHRTHQQEVVAKLGNRALAAGELKSFLEELVTMVAQTLDVELVEILELQGDSELLMRSGTGWKPGVAGQARFSAAEGTPLGQLLATRQALIVEDAVTDTVLGTSPVLREHGVVSALGCPVPRGNLNYGILAALSTRRRTFDENDRNFLQSVANVLGSAVERERMESALRSSARNLNRAQAVARIGSWAIDLPTGRVDWSEEAYHVFHQSPGTAVTRDSLLAITHPEDRTLVETMWDEALRGTPCDFEFRFLVEGETRWIHQKSEVEFDAAGQAIAVIGTSHDITERRRAADQLRQASRYNRSLLEASLDPLVTIGRDGRIMDVNEATAIATGVPRDAIVGHDFADFFSDPESARAGFQQAFREGLVRDYLLELQHTGGMTTPVLFNASSYRNEAGEVEGVFAAARDITALKKVEQALREASDYNRTLFEASPDPLAMLGCDGTLLDVNTAAESITGYTRDELIGNVCTRYFTDSNRVTTGLEQLFRDGQVQDFSLHLRPKAGGEISVLLNATVIHDAAGEVLGALVSARDITQLKQTENELLQTNRALQLLSAGNEALVRATDEQDLLDRICQIVVSLGGYRMAWVGYAEQNDSQDVRPVAQAGFHEGYLEQSRISWSEKTDRGRGPAGTAIRSGTPVIISDLQTNPSFAPWREPAIRHGLCSCAALPLITQGQTLGMLAIYSEQADAFGAHTLSLLKEMADDLAFGIAGLRGRKDRERAEEALRQTNRALRTLSACNEALVRSHDEPELMQRICDIAVNVGRYRMAWVGYPQQDDSKTIRPVASSGFEEGYIDRLQVTWDDSEWGNGPTGLAIRTGRPVVNRNTEQNPALSPWREEALARGYAASVGLPLVNQGQTLGVITIYSESADAFGPDQVQLLEELAGDLAFGMAGLRTRTEREGMVETLRGISDSALDGVILMGPDGKVVHWNPAAEKIFGYAPAEIVGKPLHEALAPPEFREQFREGMKRFQQTGQGPLVGKYLEMEAIHKNGHRFPVAASVAAINLHGEWGAVGIIRDNTDRKRTEAELKQAKEDAEAANRAKSEFLANMSHEIRTPMNGIIGLTGLVLDTELNPEQRQYLNGVANSAESLLKIINAILDFSKIEAGMIELDRVNFDLREVLGMPLQNLALRARDKGLELQYEVRPDVPDSLVGDPGRLLQVVINLVDNAIKFTQEGRISVLIEVDSIADGAANLHFCVSDTGIGIPADKQTALFGRFVQADSSTTRRYGGTGLGLAISAQLVQLMEGRIWFDSEIGRGSRFHLLVKFPIQPNPAAGRSPLPVGVLDGLKVLIVDDNATNRQILREMLTGWSTRPTDFDGAAAALAALRAAIEAREPYRLVLMDLMMPSIDGFQLLEQLRSLSERDRPQVLMLSSADEPGFADRARELGAAAYLIKPVKPSDLLETILRLQGCSMTPPAPPAAAPGVVHTVPGLRILVAEDNPVNQLLAARTLEKAGHQVQVANNGAEALAALRQNQFDIVLMDVQMPVMGGFEATSRIREQELQTGEHLPVIAMTAHALKGDREACLHAGMDGYVAKPLRNQELFQAISSVLKIGGRTVRSATQGPPTSRDDVSPHQPPATVASGDGPGTHPATSAPDVPADDPLAEDQELRKELAGLFLEDCPKLLAGIRAAINRKDGPELKLAAHTLKGSAGVFKDPPAFQAALDMEHIGKNCHWDQAESTWSRLTLEMDRLSATLRQLL